MATGTRDRGGPVLAAPPQSWLELFYDLVFVAAILVLSSAYSADATPTSVLWLTVVFGMVWATWLATTLLTNRVRLAGSFLRGLLVVQMLLVMTLVVVSNATIEDETWLSGLVFLGVMVVLALTYRDVQRSTPELRPALRFRTGRCLGVGVVLAATTFVAETAIWAPVWIGGLLLLVLPARRRDDEQLDSHHLRHRFGEFTLLMIGESFVKIGLVATEEPLRRLDFAVLPVAFVLAFSIWWLYFTDVPASELPTSSNARTGWMLLHFPFHLGIVALAVGVAKLLVTPDAAGGHGAPGGVQFLTIPLLLVTLSLVGLNLLVDGPQHRRRAHIHSAATGVLAVLGVVTFTVDPLPPEASAWLLAGVMVATAAATRRFAVAAGSPIS
jgi:low temperature requirement protein LtrA